MLRRLLRLPAPPTPTWPPATDDHHDAAVRPPLTAGQIRTYRFATTRRGLDPKEVRALLYRVADEVGELRADLIRTRTENSRLKTALRNWQRRYHNGARL